MNGRKYATCTFRARTSSNPDVTKEIATPSKRPMVSVGVRSFSKVNMDSLSSSAYSMLFCFFIRGRGDLFF